jgi:ribonuclease E
MANNKMLIDASHPEETRVAVVRGNRIEEFDFEAQAKKQLRGNIYLAKVTRVEPSLQAAFIDYGGNRHGFLAFSEIHPDYYQIPVADRLALLEEEAREASEGDDDDDGRSQRRRGRRRNSGPNGEEGARSHSRGARDDEEASGHEASGEDDDGFIDAPEDVTEIVDGREIGADEEPAEFAGDENMVVEEVIDEGDDPERGGGRSMAAAVSVDSISEAAPEEDGEPEEKAEAAGEEAPKPKRRRKAAATGASATGKTRGRKSKASKAAEAEAAGETASAEAPGGAEAVEEVMAPTAEAAEPIDDRAEEAPAPSRGSRRDEEEEEVVDSVGQEDAMEEVPFRRKLRRQYKIQEVIKRRQIMLVQVVKEERGNKGAALTTYLSLAGRYSVLMPNTARGGGISRKITNTNDRKRLKAIAQELEVPKGMGVILRTAGAMRTKAEIKRDFEYLMRLWENVRTLTLSSTAPCLVYEEGSLIKRSIRDLYDKDTGEVIVQGEAGYREAKDFMRMLMPSHAKNVKPYMEEQALFSRFGVETQLDRLLTPQVTLKSGGYIVINQTEALVSIDVNSGRSTREHSIEDTALQTNLEAAEEVARQLRLRDLAGLIVIDFIDMEEKRNNRSVEKRLKDALKHDRARIQVGRISHFGLLEMSRQRIRASVMESTMEVCPHCQGLGYVRSHSSIALHVFRSIEDYLTKHPRFDLIVRCPTVIALDILNHKRAGLIDLEQRFGLKIAIHADTTLPGQSFVIEKGEAATGIPRKPQYAAIVEAPEDDYVEPEGIEDEEEPDFAADAGETESFDQPRTSGGREQGQHRDRDRDRDQNGQRDERDGRKRRRRRRRGRRPDGGPEGSGQEGANRESGSPYPHDNADFYGAEEVEDDFVGGETAGDGNESGDRGQSATGDQDSGDAGRRRRRRGKRGGKRNRRDDETGLVGQNGDSTGDWNDEASTGAELTEAGDRETTPPADAMLRETVVAEVTREIRAEASPAPIAAEDSRAADRAGERARELAREEERERAAEVENARGRNTRRPRSTASDAVPVKTASPPAAAASEPPAQESASEDAPRKSGWWRRGGGFF